MSLDGIDIVFFDFDGVILESAGIKTEAFRELFGEGTDSFQFHLDNQGISRFEKFRFHCEEVVGCAYDDERERELNASFDALVQHQIDVAPFVPGAVELLQSLVGKTPAVVASGTPEDELRRIVAGRGIGDLFVELHGSPKKKGAIAREVLGRLGIAPSRGLFIGDALSDFDGAVDANVSFLGRVVGQQESPFKADCAVVPDLLNLPASWETIRAAVFNEYQSRIR